MKNTLILTTMLAAAFLGRGVAKEAGTLYAKDYTDGVIRLGTNATYNPLVVDTPLTLKGNLGFLDLYPGATIQFQKKQEAEEICSIFTAESRQNFTLLNNGVGDVYNITFDDGAQAIVAASAGTPITLIEDLNKENAGFYFLSTAPSLTTLKLNGVGYNQTVEMGGVQFTYVGPKEDGYTFKAGEIGFTGYAQGSHKLSLVANAPAVPEPTTGSLSLLALAGLCARRRRK